MSVTELLQKLPLRKIAPYVPAVRRLMPTAPVGVILGEDRLRLVALRQHAESDWEIVQALDQQLPPGLMKGDEVLDGGGVTEFVGRIFEQLGLDPDNVVLGVPVNYAALRRGFVPEMMPIETLRGRVERNEIPSLSFKSDAANRPTKKTVGVLPSGGGRDGMEAVVGVVLHAELRALQKAVREAGLTIHAIDHPCLAIYNAYRRTVKMMQNKSVLLYVGPSRMLGVEVNSVGPTGFRIIDHLGGTDQALRLLEDKVPNSESPEDILFRRTDALTLYGNVLEEWTAEVLKAAEEMVARVRDGADASTISVKLCGDGAQVVGLSRLIAERTGAQCEILNPFYRIARPNSGPTEHPAAFAPFIPAFGLALRHMSEGRDR